MASNTYVVPAGKVVFQTELNLDSRPYAPVIYFTQYDSTIPVISARLFLDDEPYKIPASASVNVRMQKPDGKHVYNPALGTNAERTVVYIAVTSQMTAAYGRGYAIVEIENDTGLIGSARMTLEIDRSPATKEDYQSSDEYKTLQQIIDEVNLAVEEADGHADRAEKAAKESETSKNEAQTQAEAATSSAAAAESSKDEATTQAQTATQQATAAASSATEAKSSETNALASENAAKQAQAETETARDDAQTAKDAAESSANEAEQSKNEATTQAQTAKQQATAAAASAETAAASSESAQNAQTAAEKARDEAETAKNTATDKADEAASSADNASSSETKAAAHEEAAKTSQTAAETAMNEAQTAADTATEKATAADESAKSAETSANAASSSASDAEQSATDAAMSLSAAQAAQTETETARDSAKESQTAAASSAAEAAKSAETAKEYSGNTPIVKNGNWWTWDAEEQTYKDSRNKAVLNYDKTYSSIAKMEADKDNQPVNTLAIISTDVNVGDNARLYIHNGTGWQYLADLSGFTGNGIKTWEKTAGNGAAGTSDTYTVTWTDGNSFEYQVYNGANGEGSGDMLASVYDKNNKAEDVYTYADNAAQKAASAAVQDVSAENVTFEDGRNFQEMLDSGELKGEDGTPGTNGKNGVSAGFGEPTATVDQTVGNATVTVTADGDDTAKKFHFAFSGLKGEPGAKGDTGSPGAAGAVGANGKDGFSPTVSTSRSGTVTTVTITDALGDHKFEIEDGAKGDTGAPGATGPAGPAGPTGPTGAAGKDGAAGATGPQGPAGPNTVTTATTTNITGLLKGNGSTVESESHIDIQNENDSTDVTFKGEQSVSLKLHIADDQSVTLRLDPDGIFFDSVASVPGIDILNTTFEEASPNVLAFNGVSWLGAHVMITPDINSFDGFHPEPVILRHIGNPEQDNDAATKGYVDKLKPTIQTLTLTKSGWNSTTQTLTCKGIVTDETKQIVDVSPAVSGFKAYCDAGIYVSGIGTDSLTFTCETVPSEDLTVYVSIQNVG